MKLVLELTESQVQSLLAQLTPKALTDDEYGELYYSGQSALSLARHYGVNHNHFIRAWKRLGLDTVMNKGGRIRQGERRQRASEAAAGSTHTPR